MIVTVTGGAVSDGGVGPQGAALALSAALMIFHVVYLPEALFVKR